MNFKRVIGDLISIGYLIAFILTIGLIPVYAYESGNPENKNGASLVTEEEISVVWACPLILQPLLLLGRCTT